MTLNTDQLSYANIESRPVSFDWGNRWDEDGDTKWDFYEASEREDLESTGIDCAHCCQPIGWDGSGWVHTDSELKACADLDIDSLEWIVCQGDDAGEAEPDDEDSDEALNARYHCSWIDAGPNEGIEGPMMNYYYPLDVRSSFDPREAAVAISDLPLCVVEIDGEYGLALTGGGMDLSWEICEAFIRLGEYPPFHFASQLPNMADGDHARERKTAILKACALTVDAMASRVEWARKRLQGNANFAGIDPASISVEE